MHQAQVSKQSFTCVGILLCISLASAQITYHVDSNSNSYTNTLPNSQQTFTQHFNPRSEANNVNQYQAAPSQPQQQIYSTSPQQFDSNQNNAQEDINNYFRQQLELQQQQQQRQSEPNNLYTSYQAPQQQRQSSDDLGLYYQQVQQAQLQQQQQQQQLLQQQQQLQQQQLQQQQFQQAEQPAQQSFAYQQPSSGFSDNRGPSQFAQFQSQPAKYQSQQSATNSILGTHFSPSNEVSHVKFSSGDLSYNF